MSGVHVKIVLMTGALAMTMWSWIGAVGVMWAALVTEAAGWRLLLHAAALAGPALAALRRAPLRWLCERWRLGWVDKQHTVLNSCLNLGAAATNAAESSGPQHIKATLDDAAWWPVLACLPG